MMMSLNFQIHFVNSLLFQNYGIKIYPVIIQNSLKLMSFIYLLNYFVFYFRLIITQLIDLQNYFILLIYNLVIFFSLLKL